jgi:hypothetical protein
VLLRPPVEPVVVVPVHGRILLEESLHEPLIERGQLVGRQQISHVDDCHGQWEKKFQLTSRGRVSFRSFRLFLIQGPRSGNSRARRFCFGPIRGSSRSGYLVPGPHVTEQQREKDAIHDE